MGLFDKFKKKKDSEPQIEQAVQAQETPMPVKKEEVQVQLGTYSSDILVKPLLSEKSMHMAGSGRYVFVVKQGAGKPEIKKSVQKIYNVHVEDVKIINLPAKKRRTGRTQGKTSPVKKAIVVLRKGEKIPGIIESVG